MATEKASLEDLKDLTDAAAGAEGADGATGEDAVDDVVPRQPEIDAHGRSYATGRRKTSVARVWIKPGSGRITVNGKDYETFFKRPTLRLIVNQPFDLVSRAGQFDVMVNVNGGGLSGQAGAVRHGIAQALQKYEPALRGSLKEAGFLTRDARMVERKKYGRKKARRRFQFSKR